MEFVTGPARRRLPPDVGDGALPVRREGSDLTEYTILANDTLVQAIKRCLKSLAVLVCVDGLASYVTAFLRVFRHRVPVPVSI